MSDNDNKTVKRKRFVEVRDGVFVDVEKVCYVKRSSSPLCARVGFGGGAELVIESTSEEVVETLEAALQEGGAE